MAATSGQPGSLRSPPSGLQGWATCAPFGLVSRLPRTSAVAMSQRSATAPSRHRRIGRGVSGQSFRSYDGVVASAPSVSSDGVLNSIRSAGKLLPINSFGRIL
jgi:hypothetical protein